MVGVALVTTVVGLYASKDWVATALDDWSGPDWVLRKLALGLLASTGAVLLAWLYVTRREIEMLRRLARGWVRPRYGPSGVAVVLVSAAALAVLLASANEPVVYAAVFIVLKVGECWGGWQIQNGIRAGIEDAQRLRPTSSQLAAIPALRTFYLDRPSVPLAGTWIGVGALAFGLALLSRSTPDPDFARAELAGAFIVLIACEISNELIYARWRWIRDRQLEAAGS